MSNTFNLADSAHGMLNGHWHSSYGDRENVERMLIHILFQQALINNHKKNPGIQTLPIQTKYERVVKRGKRSSNYKPREYYLPEDKG